MIRNVRVMKHGVYKTGTFFLVILVKYPPAVRFELTVSYGKVKTVKTVLENRQFL